MRPELWRRAEAFLFPVESDVWLARLRIGLGIQVALYCVALWDDWEFLLAGTGRGLISRQLSEVMLRAESGLVPQLGWLIGWARFAGLDEKAALFLVWLALLLAGCFLIAGLFCRASAIAAWFLHLCAAKSAGPLSYGVDTFMTIGLFYLMLAPLPDRSALDWKWRGRDARGRNLLGFSRRVMQVHLCLIYFFSGLTKSLGDGWWDGSNIWRALTRPPFNLLAPEFIAPGAPVLPLLGASICLLEVGYPVLIWSRRTRYFCLGAVCIMHLGIGFAMGMHLFALIMIVLNLAAFAPGKRLPFRLDACPLPLQR